MRLDDWQKWLEDQFLDTNPPTDKGDQQLRLEEARPVQAAVAVLEPPSVARPMGEREETARRPTAPVTRGAEAPLRSSTVQQTPGGPPDAELPRIENYLPFLRARLPRPADAAQAAPPEPAGTTAAATSEEAPPVEGTPAGGGGHAEDLSTAEAASADAYAVGPDAETPSAAPEREPAASAPAAPRADVPPVEQEAQTAQLPRKRRGRSARNVTPPELAPPLTGEAFWELAPRHIRTLVSMGHDDDVQRSYRRQFKESRLALIERLLDPTLSLEDTARLLNVCPTTVRRYTNRGQLRHQRTPGDQRRFRLSDVLAFMEAQQPDDPR